MYGQVHYGLRKAENNWHNVIILGICGTVPVGFA